jgi:LmbE family N-acetylglucosaminyl deacetylase
MLILNLASVGSAMGARIAAVTARSTECPGGTMTDHTKGSTSPDPHRIDIHREHELRDWAESLGVTQQQVRDAVKAVGDSTTKVREYLGKKAREPHPTSA